MLEITDEHIIILRRLYQGSIVAGGTWDSCRKPELSQLWSIGYIGVTNREWHITDEGENCLERHGLDKEQTRS